jgi:hypothetical protein
MQGYQSFWMVNKKDVQKLGPAKKNQKVNNQ